jgi:hypothetical protein
LPAARGNWEADEAARGVEPGLVALFDFEADGETDADLVGVTEACVVGCALVECRGVDEGVLDGGGWPEPTMTVPVMLGWIEQ